MEPEAGKQNPNTSTSDQNHNNNPLLLPWIWVIQSLADQPNLDPSLLHHLIGEASKLKKPTSTHDSETETHLERLALYQLEDLLFLSQPTTGTGTGTSTAKDATLGNSLGAGHLEKRIVINMSDRAQDVLRLLRDNMEIPDMKMLITSDSMKCEIRQFILHKRAALPKLFGLQQLKSAILEDVDQSASRLKEITGFGKEDELVRVLGKCLNQSNGLERIDQQDERIRVNDDDPSNTATDNRDENMNDVEIQLPNETSCYLGGLEIGNQHLLDNSCGKDQTSTRKVSHTINNAAEIPEQSLKDGGVHSKNQKSVTFTLENTNKVVHGNPRDGSLISSDKETSSFVEKEQAHFVSEGTVRGNCDDKQPGPSRSLSSVDKEVNGLAKGCILVDNGDGYECVALKRHEQCINSQIQNNLSRFPSTSGVIPEEAHHRKDDIFEPQGDNSERHANLETSSVFDKNLDKFANIDLDEETVIAAEKRSFLSSLNTFNQEDSRATAGGTEVNICFKCNEGGQLLTCCVSNCSVAVHEGCLDPSIDISDSGSFQCLNCSHVQALAAYREAKKKTASVKKKVASKKSHLSEYISLVTAQRPLRPSEMAPTGDRELINSRTVGEANFQNDDIHGSSSLQREIIDNQPMQDHHSGDLPQRGKAVMTEDQPSASKKRKYVEAHRGERQTGESSRHATTASIHQDHADVEKEFGDWERYTSDTHREPSSRENVNVAENKDDEISNARRKPARVPTQRSNSVKRQSIPWTAEEDKMLRDGVFEFTSKDGKIIHWTKILAFGSQVFKNRIPADLKFRWRQIVAERRRRKVEV